MRASVRSLLLLILFALPAPAAALEATRPDRPALHLAVEGHLALFSGAERHPLIDPGLGWAVRLGVGPGEGLGWFVHAEHSIWMPTQSLIELPSLLNLGVGGEYRFAGGKVRSSVAVGTSTLLFSTPIDPAGSTGLFLDVRPVGLRWAWGRHFLVGVDPLTLSIAAPVLTGIPLVRIQHRSTAVLEIRR